MKQPGICGTHFLHLRGRSTGDCAAVQVPGSGVILATSDRLRLEKIEKNMIEDSQYPVIFLNELKLSIISSE